MMDRPHIWGLESTEASYTVLMNTVFITAPSRQDVPRLVAMVISSCSDPQLVLILIGIDPHWYSRPHCQIFLGILKR